MSKSHIYAAIIIVVAAIASLGGYYLFSITQKHSPTFMTLRAGHLLADELRLKKN